MVNEAAASTRLSPPADTKRGHSNNNTPNAHLPAALER